MVMVKMMKIVIVMMVVMLMMNIMVIIRDDESFSSRSRHRDTGGPLSLLTSAFLRWPLEGDDP